MKQSKIFLALAFIAISLSVSAGAPRNAPAPAANGGGVAPAPTSKSYTVNVSLSRNPGERGSLQVVENTAQGSRVVKTCPAIGGTENHPDGQSSRRTPPGAKRVYETYAHLKYKPSASGWLNGVNATYFENIWGNPVAIHSGNLDSNSHACVRTTSECASFIKAKADSVGQTDGGSSSIIPGAAKRRFNMEVNVTY